MGKLAAAGSLAMVLGLGGCDRKPKAAPATPPPATAPAPTAAPTATAPAIRAATTQVVPEPAEPSVMEIDGKPYFFPPARLRVQEKEGVVRVQVYSSTAPTIPEKSDSGNLYYFDIPLDIDDPVHLEEAQWAFKATSQEQDDSPNGIFLDGMKTQLQPYDVRILFDRDGQRITARVVGRFLQFSDDQPAPRQVKVDAALTPIVQRP